MKNMNQETADKLDRMDLSENAREVISNTDFGIFYEVFGKMNTPEEVEEFCKECSDGE